MTVDFEQFGAFAIVCVLLVTAVLYLVRQGAQKDRKIDDLQDKRLEDAKEYNTQIKSSLDNLATLTQQIRDAIFNNNRGA